MGKKRTEGTYQVLQFIKAKTFRICQMIQKTSRSSNLSFEGNDTVNILRVRMKALICTSRFM
jgi:K+-transporting ATPase c subunit